jgi:hypothetical protein
MWTMSNLSSIMTFPRTVKITFIALVSLFNQIKITENNKIYFIPAQDELDDQIIKELHTHSSPQQMQVV